MKKIISLILSLLMIVCLSACGNNEPDVTHTDKTEQSTLEENSDVNNCPIEIIAQEATGTEYGYSHANFTVKNVSGETINTLTIDIKILDKNNVVLSTTHPQEGVRIANNEAIVIEALAEEGAYSMKLDGYSYYTGEDLEGEYVQGYFSETEEVVLICGDTDTTANTSPDDESNDADLEVGFVKNIHTAADIPNELMNDEFKSVIDLFSKGFSQSGLDITKATTYDDGETYIFYLDNLEFLGNECEDGALQPRIIYSEDAINNNGTPNKMFFEIANPLKSNGYKETVEMVEDIAEALDISDEGLIDNDYSSSSKWATGEYATFTFPNLNLKLTVSNTDGTVEIEIVHID